MSKVLAILTIGWAILLTLLAVFWVDLDAPFMPIAGLGELALFFLGAILIVGWGYVAKTIRRYIVPGIAVTFIVGCSFGFVYLPDEVSWKAKFYRHKRGYEARVAEIYQMSQQQLQGLLQENKAAITYKDCSIDLGPPIRVAFVWDGIIDNWYGVIYDPSDTVQQANEKEWSDPSYRELKGIFGGDLVGVTHIEGHWYFCSFT